MKVYRPATGTTQEPSQDNSKQAYVCPTCSQYSYFDSSVEQSDLHCTNPECPDHQ